MIEIAPELAVWQQVRVSINLYGVCIREVGEGAGEPEYRCAWRQLLHSNQCLTVWACP